MPFGDQREQAVVGDEVADRVVLGDLAEPDRTEVPTWGQHGVVAGERHRGQHRTQAPSGRARDFWVRDAAIAQPAQPFGTRTAPELLASSGQEIRKTCGVAAYLRVVIEKHRTQASRTMNVETAQAVTDRVN